MKNLKFRVWNEESKSMTSDITLGFIAKEYGTMLKRKTSEYIWMQFIGLQDKNGNDIFEGDVVFNSNKTFLTCKEDPKTYLVKWQEGKYKPGTSGNGWLAEKPGFIFEKIQPTENAKYMSLVFNQSQIEIVGNIYENPELLNTLTDATVS